MSEKSKEGLDSLPPSYEQALMPSVSMMPHGSPTHSPGHGVIQQQPTVVYVQATPIPANEAPDHLVMAIVATVCCCLPLGVVAIIKASECKAQRAAGNRDLAVVHSRSARKWALWAICIGTVAMVIWCVSYFYLRKTMERMEAYDYN